MLRPQQKELYNLTQDIINKKITLKKLFLFWVPGGGKSLAPVILSDLLTEGKKQIWIVPRNSLKYQGEAEFQNNIYPVDKVARVADNHGDPFRGCDICLTTYQAIGANPMKWLNVCKKYNTMIILDEFHHLSNHGEWLDVIRPMVKDSFLSVFMTGTTTRGDKTKIPFIPYKHHDIDFADTNDTKWIIYKQDQALKDKSVLPFKTILINGSGSYIDKNQIERSFNSFGLSGDELRCAFKTEYAFHALDMTIYHWKLYKNKHRFSKLLIVSPDIKTAEIYLDYIKKYSFIIPGIATSQDNKECKENIKRFKKNNNTFGALNCLVTVAVAYEGLSVPEITHMIILTLIRTNQWIEQCVGRCTRNYPNKLFGFVFAPEDPRLIKVLKYISMGKLIKADGETPDKNYGESANPEASKYINKITPLSSQAHNVEISNISIDKIDNKVSETQSEKENRLRKQINSVINNIVGSEEPGNRRVKQRIFWLRVKQLANYGRNKEGKLIKKPLDEMSLKELEIINEFAQIYK